MGKLDAHHERTFTSRPKSLLALLEVSVFLCGIYVISQKIHVISIDQQLMCPI
jgi:hypothetical protein